MLPRPDSQSFTRFMLSAGVFLVVVGVVLPGFILRDTGVLTIPERDLHALTPTAREELERRQHIAQDAGEAAPYLGGALFAAGLLLILFGVPRLLGQERKEDERSAMELDKLRVELRPQSAQERRERLTADDEPPERSPDEAEAVRPDDEEKGPEVRPEPRPQVKSEVYFPRYLRQRAGNEAAVLARLSEIVPSSYELQTQVKLEGASPLLLDALFISSLDRQPDIVVEIKFASASVVKNLKNRIAEAENAVFRYMRRYARRSIGWLILVVEEDLPVGAQGAIDEAIASSADLMHISFVTPDSLEHLTLPVETI